MSGRLPPVGTSATFAQPTPPPASCWNRRTVTLLCGTGLLALLCLTLLNHFGKLKALGALFGPSQTPSNKFAKIFIRFEPKDFTISSTESFVIRCLDNKKTLFFEQTSNINNGLEFYITNCPLKQPLHIEFYVDAKNASFSPIDSVTLTVNSGTEQYYIRKNQTQFETVAEKAPSLEIPATQAKFTAETLETQRLYELKNGEVTSLEADHMCPRPEKYFTLRNEGKKSVVIVKLALFSIPKKNGETYDFPLIIGAAKTKEFSLEMLNNHWKTLHQQKTGKPFPESKLDLSITGIQQKLYSTTK